MITHGLQGVYCGGSLAMLKSYDAMSSPSSALSSRSWRGCACRTVKSLDSRHGLPNSHVGQPTEQILTDSQHRSVALLSSSLLPFTWQRKRLEGPLNIHVQPVHLRTLRYVATSLESHGIRLLGRSLGLRRAAQTSTTCDGLNRNSLAHSRRPYRPQTLFHYQYAG
jgi:hypothetical protein